MMLLLFVEICLISKEMTKEKLKDDKRPEKWNNRKYPIKNLKSRKNCEMKKETKEMNRKQ
jgi:hypothetical protein